MCNLFENGSSSEWLLYISEWTAPHTTSPLSNIRVTTKVAVTALLSDNPLLQDRGSAIIYNLAIKEVKTVVGIQFQFYSTQFSACCRSPAVFWFVSNNKHPSFLIRQRDYIYMYIVAIPFINTFYIMVKFVFCDHPPNAT
jgi:hypothetical protein